MGGGGLEGFVAWITGGTWVGGCEFVFKRVHFFMGASWGGLRPCMSKRGAEKSPSLKKGGYHPVGARMVKESLICKNSMGGLMWVMCLVL